jgi:mRNA interferase YafQ
MMNKYTPDYSTQFRRNRRLLIKRGYDMSKLEITIDLLLRGDLMPSEYRDHPLKGNYIGYRECHVGGEGDWLLIYKKHNNKLILVFTATGTHADLFE